MLRPVPKPKVAGDPFYALPSDDVSNPLFGISCLLPAFFLKIFSF